MNFYIVFICDNLVLVEIIDSEVVTNFIDRTEASVG